MSRTDPLHSLGQRVADKRGKAGLRATAREIGLSPSTLARVEGGQLPDLENFRLICRWLGTDPAELLGVDAESLGRTEATAHFRGRASVSPETSHALGELIREAAKRLEVDAKGEPADAEG